MDCKLMFTLHLKQESRKLAKVQPLLNKIFKITCGGES